MVRKVLAILLVLVMVLGMGVDTALTQELPPVTVEVIPTPEIGVEEPANPGSIFTPELIRDIFLFITFLVVGFAAGRYNPGKVAREIQKDKNIQDSMERIALNTIPVTALGHIRDIVADMGAVIDVLKRVTDGLPNEPNPPAPPTAG